VAQALDLWLEGGMRPFLDVIVAPDGTIKCFRVRHEGEWSWIANKE
jgi:hypothetical protein